MFKGNVPSQPVDSAGDYLQVASASLASVNLAAKANQSTRTIETTNCSLIALTLPQIK